MQKKFLIKMYIICFKTGKNKKTNIQRSFLFFFLSIIIFGLLIFFLVLFRVSRSFFFTTGIMPEQNDHLSSRDEFSCCYFRLSTSHSILSCIFFKYILFYFFNFLLLVIGWVCCHEELLSQLNLNLFCFFTISLVV